VSDLQDFPYFDDDDDNATTVDRFEMLTFAEEACDVGLGTNHEYDADSIVVSYDSMVTPTQSIEIDMNDTTKRTVLKERVVPGYQKENYSCERLTVTARDGKTRSL
jgi:oligopeptidase B